jgi:hypothetical protein
MSHDKAKTESKLRNTLKRIKIIIDMGDPDCFRAAFVPEKSRSCEFDLLLMGFLIRPPPNGALRQRTSGFVSNLNKTHHSFLPKCRQFKTSDSKINYNSTSSRISTLVFNQEYQCITITSDPSERTVSELIRRSSGLLLTFPQNKEDTKRTHEHPVADKIPEQRNFEMARNRRDLSTDGSADFKAPNRILSETESRINRLEGKLSAGDEKFKFLEEKLLAGDKMFKSLEEKLSACDKKLSACDEKVKALEARMEKDGLTSFQSMLWYF